MKQQHALPTALAITAVVSLAGCAAGSMTPTTSAPAATATPEATTSAPATGPADSSPASPASTAQTETSGRWSYSTTGSAVHAKLTSLDGKSSLDFSYDEVTGRDVAVKTKSSQEFTCVLNCQTKVTVDDAAPTEHLTTPVQPKPPEITVRLSEPQELFAAIKDAKKVTVVIPLDKNDHTITIEFDPTGVDPTKLPNFG